jgi:hypothetical protein
MGIYKGLCIGGAADGQWLERDEDRIEVKKFKKNPEGGPDILLENTTYDFLLLLRNLSTEIGCWAPRGTPVEQVIWRLVKGYNPREKINPLAVNNNTILHAL